MPAALDVFLGLLQIYFLLMNFTVERFYCHGPLLDGDKRFLVPETISFCAQNNKLFLARPDWMVSATCISAYCLASGYVFLLYVIAYGKWRQCAIPLLLLLGAKIYAIGFYHFMEFTSSTPPGNLVAYFSVEGPYIVSMAIVLYRVSAALAADPVPSSKKRS